MTDLEKYILTRWLYSIGEKPLMEDPEYARLHSYITEKNLLPEYSSRSWSDDPCPIDLLNRYNMSQFIYKISLTDKTESIPSITSIHEARKYYERLLLKFVVSFKMDGWNLQLTYFNGELVKVQTRGRSSDALEVTFLKKYLPSKIGIGGEVRVTGELCLSHDSFAKLKRMYPDKGAVSQRSSVRTALANERAASLLTFLAFDIVAPEVELSATQIFSTLNQWGFDTPEWRVATNGMEVLKAIKELSDMYENYSFIADGAVVRAEVGRDIKAVRVFSWEENIYHSFITGIEEEPSSSAFGCKLLIYPIRTIHSNQVKVNITNIARIIEYGLYPGTPLAFGLRSDANADPNLDVTRYLQEIWRDRYGVFKDRVIVEEAMKQEKLNRLEDGIGYEPLRGNNVKEV